MNSVILPVKVTEKPEWLTSRTEIKIHCRQNITRLHCRHHCEMCKNDDHLTGDWKNKVLSFHRTLSIPQVQRKHIHKDQQNITLYYSIFNMSIDLSWCHCRSWPCCQPTAPDHRVRRNTVKEPSVAAAALYRCCRAAGVYRNPAHPPGPAAGCASSLVVLLVKRIANTQGYLCV